MSTDPYYILGLPHTASIEEVKRAYRQKAMHLHPDRNSAPDAEEAFRSVTDAYELIISGNWQPPEKAAGPKHPDPAYNASRSREEFEDRREAARDRSRQTIWEARFKLMRDRNRLRKSGWFYPLMIAAYGLYVGIWALIAILLLVPVLLSWQVESPLLLLLIFPLLLLVKRMAKRAEMYRAEMKPYFK